MKTSTLICASISLAASLGAAPASARELPAMQDIRKASSQRALDEKVLSDLHASASYDKQPGAVLQALQNGGLAPGKASKGTSGARSVSYVGPDWGLEIALDGTYAKYHRQFPSYRRVPLSARQPVEVIQRKAEQLLRGSLAPLVPTSESDQLVPIHLREKISSGASADGVQEERMISRTMVVFGRRVNGTFVTGPGSKVYVEFDSDDRITKLSYDWKKLEPRGPAKKSLPIAAFRERTRAAGLAAFEAGSQIESFECGYYDPGRKENARVAVPACALSYKDAKGDGTVHIAPLSDDVSEDPLWKRLSRPGKLGSCN